MKKAFGIKLIAIFENSKRRRSYPAVIVGRLAANENYSGQGLGTFILDNIKYAFSNVKRLGCRFITVDALKTAVPFYERNGFQCITESDKRLCQNRRSLFYSLMTAWCLPIP